MFSVIWAVITSSIDFLTEWAWGHFIGHKSSEEVAVDTETKMGQDIADEPSQAQAVAKLENDDV